MGTTGKIKEAEFESLYKKFTEATKDFESSLNKIKNEMSGIDGKNETWRGKTAIAVRDKYKTFEDNFDEINSKLDAFGSHLNTTLNNYRSAMQKSEKTLSETEENFDIN